MSDSGWTDARVTRLETLWREGLSASQVARSLGGVTRNAVIGKIHRLGLSGRSAASALCRRAACPKPTAPRRRRRTLAAPRPRPVTPAAVVGPEEPGLVASLTALAPHVCKWPIGDPKAADFSFCGRAASGAGPYCADHHRRAYPSQAPSSLDRDPAVRRVLAGLAA